MPYCLDRVGLGQRDLRCARYEYSPDTRIIVLTQSDKKADVLSAIHSGANGYLLKSAPIEEITKGIHTVMKGGASLDAEVASLIMHQIQSSPLQSQSPLHLTPRESRHSPPTRGWSIEERDRRRT